MEGFFGFARLLLYSLLKFSLTLSPPFAKPIHTHFPSMALFTFIMCMPKKSHAVLRKLGHTIEQWDVEGIFAQYDGKVVVVSFMCARCGPALPRIPPWNQLFARVLQSHRAFYLG